MNIGIKIVERKPIVEGSPRLICGNSGDTITFTFDSEWSNYTAKLARFVYVKNGVVVPEEVLFNGNVAEIPVLSNITEVFIGVYAGDLRTTTPVTIPCDLSILCKGGKPVDPTPDIYAQILDALNAKLILEGNASSATKLETPRTIQVDLANSNGVSFDGTEDVNPGVTGVLPKEHGGSGTPTPELIFAPHGVKRVNGSAIAVNDSSKSPLANLKLYGKTEQDGTPTPTEPKELQSVGDSGSFEVGVFTNNLLPITEAQSTTVCGITFTSYGNGSYRMQGTSTGIASYIFALPTPICFPEDITPYLQIRANAFRDSVTIAFRGGDNYTTQFGYRGITTNNSLHLNELKGKKMTAISLWVASGVTVDITLTPSIEFTNATTDYSECIGQSLTMPYTLRSVGDIKDEVDFNRGVLIQRCLSVTGFYKERTMTNSKVFDAVIDKLTIDEMNGYGMALCSHVSNYDFHTGDTTHFYLHNTRAIVYLPIDTDDSVASEIEVIGVLETPIETPLTETELNAYRQLYTNKGNTTILSEAEAEVDYYTDTLSGETLGNLHSSLYSEIETLKQAIVSLGGEV